MRIDGQKLQVETELSDGSHEPVFREVAGLPWPLS
jgi:hypothetical protein